MIISSWDVGIVNLAYCILEYNYDDETQKTTIRIIDWDRINLVEDDRIQLNCCGEKKNSTGSSRSLVCGKKASYYLDVNNTYYGFCKVHLKQSEKYWTPNDTKKLFSNNDPEKVGIQNPCDYLKKSGDKCGIKSKYHGQNKYYCTTHYKSVLNKKLKQDAPKMIKNLIVKKYPTSKLQFNLIKKLDTLAEHFARLGVEEVIIENQPSYKNPKMKSIANTLFDYFLIRGYVDKIHKLDLKLVRFMCPSNKLKVNENNTLEVLKANKNEKQKYKLTKELGIKYTKQLLNDIPEQLQYLDLFRKQDDICDAYLQGRYYLEYIRNGPKSKVITKARKEERKEIM